MLFKECTDMIGMMFLNKVFDRSLKQNNILLQSTEDVKNEAAQFYEAVMELHETVVHQS